MVKKKKTVKENKVKFTLDGNLLIGPTVYKKGVEYSIEKKDFNIIMKGANQTKINVKKI